MPVNASMAGAVYPPTQPYLFSREKIREFADAIGDPNPAYRSVEAAQALGYPDVIGPPTLPIVVTIPAGYQFTHDPAAGVDYARLVHGEQRFEYVRPLHAGDVVRVVVKVDSLRVAAGNELISTSAQVRAADSDELIVTGYAVLVVRGTAA